MPWENERCELYRLDSRDEDWDGLDWMSRKTVTYAPGGESDACSPLM